MKHTKTSLGFTLIELLIVVAIIGILAAIAVPNFMNARIRANIARVRADQKSISTALELYHMDNNCYLITMSGASEFYHLTTPTPYLSSVPVDVFLPWKGSRGTASRNPDDRFPTFDYTGNDWFTGDAKNHPHAYIMESVGPDQVHIPELHGEWAAYKANPPDSVFNKFIYNPSNGLKSYGSIPRGGGQGRTFAED